jgi:hypothetical protein
MRKLGFFGFTENYSRFFFQILSELRVSVVITKKPSWGKEGLCT